MEICKMESCFGCALCSDSCPVNAIEITDKDGFYRPIVDGKKCIGCNKCKNVCPANHVSVLPELNDEVPCYGAYSKNERVHYECSSGGICTEISKKFILNGGVVVGSWFNPELQRVEHRICDNLDDLKLIAKSKYVQSSLEGIYKAIDKQIKIKKCLFIGVPCQVNAVRQHFENNENLFCIDLLCRGGASSLCLREHMENMKCGKHITNISFRGGEHDCYFMMYTKGDRIVYRGPQFIDPYFNAFMLHVLYQERCYECPFAGKQRIGDLTLGDFWGLEKSLIPSLGGHGINMIFVNSYNGRNLLDSIINDIELIERTAKEAINGNDTLREPTEKPSEYEELWSRIRVGGFAKALDYYEKEDYNNRCRESKRWWRMYRIKKVIKNVLGINNKRY